MFFNVFCVAKLGFALKLNKRLIKAEQLELQKELELAYEDFGKRISEYCA